MSDVNVCDTFLNMFSKKAKNIRIHLRKSGRPGYGWILKYVATAMPYNVCYVNLNVLSYISG